jgi:HD-GYP domain-containing protein (c-di-GMP phosphodiesterase class II)
LNVTAAPEGLNQKLRLDSEGDELVEQTRARVRLRLGNHERLASLLVGGSFFAAAIPLAIFPSSQRSPSILVLVLLVAAYAVASRILFEVGPGFALPTELVLVPMLFLAPVGLVPLLVAAGHVAGALFANAKRGMPLQRAFVVPANCWFAVGPATVLLARGEGPPRWSDWPFYVAALAAQFGLDYGSAALREWLALGVSPKAHLRFAAWICGADLTLAPIGLLIAFACGSFRYAFLLAMPLVGLFAFFAQQRRVGIDRALALGNAYRGTAFLLGDVVESNDAYTGSHSRDVVELVVSVATELRVDANTRRDAEFAALLHDVGKIHVPNEIINKPGPLDDAEWEIMKQHTIKGEEMLGRVGGLLGDVGKIVRASHEHYDGRGYPDRLAGEKIPMAARIVSCCDAFSAMTTDRSYRSALSLEAATAELRAERGIQFDPDVVDALLRVLEREGRPLL